MSNKELEEILKEKLNQESGSHQEQPDWDVFSKILQNSEGFEKIGFDDDKVSEKLNKHTVAFSETHWQLLKERLIKEEQIRKKLFTVKSLEVIFLLLLLFTFQNYENTNYKNSFKPSIPIVNATHNAAPGFLPSTAPQSKLLNTSIEKTGDNAIILSRDLLAYASSTKAYKSGEKYDVFVNHDAIKNSALDLVNPQNIPLGCKNNILLNDGSMLFYKNQQHKIFNNISAIDVKKSSLIGDKINIQLPSLILPVKPKTQIFLTASLSGGLGIAHSGFDPIYKIAGYQTYSSQFGAGLLYSVKNNKFEVQSGLRYTKKNYEPNQLVETYGDIFSGFRKISLDRISYDIVDIPLSLKYFIKEGKKTSFFVKAGANINFSLANNYLVSSGPSSEPASNFASREAISDGAEIDKASRLSQKEFNPGLLQNVSGKKPGIFTSLGNNSFITLSGELGLERKLSEKNALVFGVEYNKYYRIDGIGPNKDKLSALTLNLGVKHSL
jgi:uncharacterized DUF497 family protein